MSDSPNCVVSVQPVTGRRRVCFSLPFAAGLLTDSGGYFGGAEVRGVTFLRGIAKDPTLDVHVVVMEASVPVTARVDGITVHVRPQVAFSVGQQDDATRSVWGAIDAELYVAFGANDASSELARFCQAHGSALLLSLASDAAFQSFVYEGSNEPDAYGVRGHYLWYCMRHAHEVVVQTEQQQTKLRALVSRESTIIRNPAPAGVRAAPRTAPAHGGRILWIGRTDPNKRYDEALALAAALPHRPMIMVCNNILSFGSGSIAEFERALPNLMLADQVALADIDALFQFSDLLVNTSGIEGFPNTFLQAGMHGIPIVSMTVDPDGMLSRHGCGRVADGTRAGMARAVESLLQDRSRYAAAAAASVRWVHERHDADGRVAELSATIHRLLTTHARRSAAHAA